MSLLAPAICDVGPLPMLTPEIFIARMAAAIPKRFGWASAVRAGLGGLRPAQRGAHVAELSEPAIEFHVTPTAKNHDILGLVVPSVVVFVMTVRAGGAAALARRERIASLGAVSLRLSLSRVALPGGSSGSTNNRLIRPAQILTPSSHGPIICQRCHQRNAAETRRAKRRNLELFA